MTTPPATHPASYCPDAAHTLQWGLHPDSVTQGWILRRNDGGSSVVAALDGYPHGRTPVSAGEAREWADRILGAAQEWVEQPARSGAYHRHNTVVAFEPSTPGAALNTDPQTAAESLESIRRALAAVAADRPTPEQIAEWDTADKEMAQRVRAALPGVPLHHAYAVLQALRVTQRLDAAAAPAAVPPADRAGLRDRIADATVPLLLDTLPKVIARSRGYEVADAVLALLFGPIAAGTDTATWTAIRAIQLMNEAGRERDTSAEAHRLALSTALGLGTGAPWDAIRGRAAELAGQDAAGDDEGDELVCVDECGSCDACGMEPFGTPGEGWREAARFLRRTARTSGNREGALHGARLIETELRRLAEDATPVAPSAATPNGTGAVVAASGDRAALIRAAEIAEDVAEGLRKHHEFERSTGALDVMTELRRLAAETPGPETQGEADEWCKCRSCWGWFVEDHPGEDLDELGKDLGWWSGLPEHRDAPAGVSQPETVHACPPDGSGLTPCCGRTPFELPLGDRISSEAPVTCTHPAVTLPGKEA